MTATTARVNPRAHPGAGIIGWTFAALAGCAVTAWLALSEILPGGDYVREAQPSLEALVHGHVASFLRLVPAYGGSLVERAPFALIPGLWGGGERAVYVLVALPCLLAGAALGLWLLTRVRSGPGSAFVRAITLCLCVANPLTFRALELGHPEELLGGVLCVAGVLFAQRGRPVAAGILLGLAIANKEWALLALGPALLALPSRRVLMLVCTAAAAGLVLAPLVLIGGGGFLAGAGAVAAPTGAIFLPMQVFWLLGQTGAAGQLIEVLGRISHPLIIALSLPLTALLWRRRAGQAEPPQEPRGGDHRPPGTRARRAPADAMLLLALLLLARCMLDPWDNVYYPLPMVIALLAWETCARRRAPALALAATVVAWLNGWFALNGHPQGAAELFLAWTLPLAIWMTWTLYLRGRVTRAAQTMTVSSLLRPVRISAPSSVTTARSSIRTPQLPGR